MSVAKVILASMVTLGVVGCTTLHTDIRAFDSTCVDDARVAKAVALQRAATVRALLADDAFEKQGKAVTEAGLEAFAELPNKGVQVAASVTDAIVRAEFDTQLGGLAEAEKLNREGLVFVDEDKFQEAIGSFEAANTKVSEAVAASRDSMGVLLGDGADVFLEGLDSRFVAAQEELVGDTIFDDSMLAVVLYAPDGKSSQAEVQEARWAKKHRRLTAGCWSAVADATKTKAWGGNSDIAVKMQQDGTFTVKGLRMDASKVTQAFFELSSQAVCFAAKTQGVGGGCGGGDAEPTALAPEAQASEAAAVAKLRQHAALQMLEEAVARGNEVSNINVATPVGRVRQTVDAYLPQLEVKSDVKE